MKCPNCNSDIAWYKIFGLTRWTALECKQCNSLFNRKFNAQLFIMVFLSVIGLMGVVLFAGFIIDHWGIIAGIILGFILALLWSMITSYVDAETVRLAPVEKRKGLKAILGDKYLFVKKQK